MLRSGAFLRRSTSRAASCSASVATAIVEGASATLNGGSGARGRSFGALAPLLLGSAAAADVS